MAGLPPGYQTGVGTVDIRVREFACQVTARPWLRAAPQLSLEVLLGTSEIVSSTVAVRGGFLDLFISTLPARGLTAEDQ